MKKILGLIGILTGFTFTTFAKQVDENTAKQVGYTFLTTKTNSQIFGAGTTLNLVYTSKSQATSSNASMQATTYFYVYNAGSTGYVMVSGDDIVIPILGYSSEGAFDPNNIPVNAAKWFEGYKDQIRFAIDNEINASEEIKNEWQNLINGTDSSNGARAGGTVSPLIQSRWDQSPYYNALCPYDNQYGSRTVVGCVATAMAQIMKYWSYPEIGSGFHSYNHSTYGTLSANFGNTTYEWSSMPNKVTSSNSAVATLMYHCGVSVDMNYGVGSKGGSGAQTLDVVDALKTYFGYPTSVEGKYRSSYSDAQWKTLLKGELDASRPIQYAGTGSGGGHSFVCDGYDNNDFFHFNWGWSGSSDGYFSINNLNPLSLGTGGGSGGFNSNQRAIIGIQSPPSTQSYDMALYNNVTPSSDPIYYGNSFTISTNIANNGTNSFNGDYCAAIFDDAYNFVDFVEIKTGYSLKGGYAYTNNLVFSTTGIFGMLPGKYYIGIYYRPTGGNWVIVSNSSSYSNMQQMSVVNIDDIEMYSSMTVSPGNVLTEGQSASVNFNIVNDGSTTYTGQYRVNLYNLDGTFVETISTLSENNGLPSTYVYKSPYLTFSTNAITAAPGTYLLAALHKPTGSSQFQLIGSSYYQNPIKITVATPAIQPDKYETNDNQGQSYTLPVTFSGNTATIKTVGSNFHIGSDYDYYKINLPDGYTYSITPRIHDSYNSGNGNNYTIDALFSYSIDGNTWSDAFDDLIIGDISANGGTTIYFHVSPYFTGETGTYLLDVLITRSISAGEKDVELSSAINIFPNPTSGNVTIDATNLAQNVNQINILNVQGQMVFAFNQLGSKAVFDLNLTNLPEGIYVVQLQTSAGVLSKRLILNK
jgi:hypothetical protein